MDEELNVKDQTDKEQLSDDLKEFLTDLRQKIEKDQDNRIGWIRKLVTANNQRLGIKRVSTKPYLGAPNIPLPVADKAISKLKPNFVLSAFLPKKKAFVQISEGTQETPELKEKARKAELGLNYVLNNKIDLLNILSLASDMFLEKGHCIFKVIEKFCKNKVRKVIQLSDYPQDVIKQLKKMRVSELELFLAERYELDPQDKEDKKIIADIINQFKSGKEVIEFDLYEYESYPDIIVRNPEKVTPPPWATDIEYTERLVDEYYLTKRELSEGAEEGRYNKTIIDELDKLDFSGKGKSMSADDLLEANKERNEGVIDEGDDELFRIHEVYCWYKPKGSDCYERWVFVFLADVGALDKALIQKIRFPYEFKVWNFVKHDNEVKDNRWHASRGVPEKVRALQEFMEKSVNNMLIRDEINNAPVYTVLSTSNIQSNTIRFIPGQKIKVKSHQEIARLDDQNKVDVSSERIGQILKAYAEEYIGSTDQLFRNATNKGGGKTLGEIETGIQQQSAPINLDVLRWFSSLKKVYTLVFLLMRERFGRSIYIEGSEITREDFNFDAVIIPNGSIDLADQNLRVNKAINHLNFAMKAPPDIVDAEDRYNAAFDWLEADGVQNPDRYITRPEEIMAKQQEQMMKEEQVLAQEEGKLDNQIRSLKAQQILGGGGGQPNQSQPPTA
jgi:hypothetical protein